MFDVPARIAMLASYVPQAVLRRIAALSTLPAAQADQAPAALLIVRTLSPNGRSES